MDLTKMKEAVARVSEEVFREMESGERATRFDVADFAVRAKDLGPKTAAWKISYDTSSGLRDQLSVSAWKISYDTSSGLRDPGSAQ